MAQLSILQETYPRCFGKCLHLPQETDPHIKQIRLDRKKEPHTEPNEAEIIGFLKRYLPLTGTLEMDETGYIFLKLSDEIIYQLSPLLAGREIEMPPYFGAERSYGAHISVVLGKQENSSKLRPFELGDTFTFTPKKCLYFEPLNTDEWTKVYFVTVEAPALSQLRMNMGLSPYLLNESFYITIGVTRRFTTLEDYLQSSSELGGPIQINSDYRNN